MKVRENARPSAETAAPTLSAPEAPEPSQSADENPGDDDADTPPTADGAGSEPGSRDPLDHDGDGRKGGLAAPPEVTHLVVLESDERRGLTAGEVIAVADADVKPLLADDLCRSATPDEVELAQPRVRVWMGLA